jgi:23S rRNA (uracil1939-C5)-methyltransferase
MKQKPPVQKGQIIECEIHGFGHSGTGVGRYEGFAVFIGGALPGERVKIRITKVKKTFAEGELLEVLTAHPERIEPICPHFDSCGGCQLQHISYTEELNLKQQQVVDQLERIGLLTDVTIHSVKGMENPWSYRNKVQIPFATVEGKVVAGFYQLGTHQVVDMEICFIQNELHTELTKKIKAMVEALHIPIYNETTHTGVLRHVLLRQGVHTDELMVVLVTNGEKLQGKDPLIAELRRSFPVITSIQQNINTARTNVILGKENRLLWGMPVIYDTIGNIQFAISPHSFFQVNPVQTEILYEQVKTYANLSGSETVIDAYCGIGSISLYLADKARRVYGMEIVPAAIEDAKQNAALNKIKNAHFELGKAEEILPKWQKEGTHADVIVVDPPRKGCDEAFLEAAAKIQPERIVYVSCNPATFARDAKYLSEHGYHLQEVQPVDMFPQTSHVELVGLFTLQV